MAHEIEYKTNAVSKLINWVVSTDGQHIDDYINKLKSQNPGISTDDLAKKIVRRKSMKNGLVGAATAIGGGVTLPVAIPTDLVTSWKIQVFMALAIARLYGHNSKTTDIKTDIYLILTGDAAKNTLKQFSIECSKDITKQAVDRYLTQQTMETIWKRLARKIITKSSEKSMAHVTKLIPFVGAPVGYVFDWLAARTVGNFAIKYYSGRG